MDSRAHKWLVTLMVLAPLPAAHAADSTSSMVATASFANPHTLNLELDYRTTRRARTNDNREPSALLDLSPALQPLNWPRNSDMRARLLTPGLKRTPLFGWIATNLYRNPRENGWCLELDPGEGEYLVLYRRHL